MARTKIRPKMPIDDALEALGHFLPRNPGKWAVYERRKHINKYPTLTILYEGNKRLCYVDEVEREVVRKFGAEAVAA